MLVDTIIVNQGITLKMELKHSPIGCLEQIQLARMTATNVVCGSCPEFNVFGYSWLMRSGPWARLMRLLCSPSLLKNLQQISRLTAELKACRKTKPNRRFNNARKMQYPRL